MDDQELTQAQKQEAFKRELLRRSLDECKVFNPTSEDYVLMWDNFPHRIPANGEAILVRYLCDRYMTEMTDKILTFRSDENVRMENERRVKKGMAIMDKHTEQPAFEMKFAINQPELRLPVLKTLWGGVVRLYGKDSPIEGTQAITPTSDRDLLAEIEKSTPVTEVTEPSLAEDITTDED